MSIYASVKTVNLEFRGQRVIFTYPDAGNMAALLQRIFSSTEYPILALPGYMPNVIFDIGANVGATAIYFSMVYPKAQIKCYEPSPQNFEFLTRNTDSFALIEKFCFGLAEAEGQAQLFFGNSQAMQNSVFCSIETTTTSETVHLRSASMELRFLEAGTILKLDTEGCELAVLEAIKTKLPLVDMIYVEYHSEEDRRAIELLVATDFVLATSHASFPHRGTNHYVARHLIERFPQLDAMRIKGKRLS
jgi:FkbM family methyltransferase